MLSGAVWVVLSLPIFILCMAKRGNEINRKTLSAYIRPPTDIQVIAIGSPGPVMSSLRF